MTQQHKNKTPVYNNKTVLRWFNIAVRTCHLAGMAVYFGGSLLSVSHDSLLPWFHGVVISGLLLAGLEWLHDRRWLHRGNGLVSYFHILCTFLAVTVESLALPLLWVVFISGSVCSHMSRKYRHWSFIDGPEK